MMIHAYDEMYLDTAMNNLGEAFDYVANTLKMDKDRFFELFISTEIAIQFPVGILRSGSNSGSTSMNCMEPIGIHIIRETGRTSDTGN